MLFITTDDIFFNMKSVNHLSFLESVVPHFNLPPTTVYTIEQFDEDFGYRHFISGFSKFGDRFGITERTENCFRTDDFHKLRKTYVEKVIANMPAINMEAISFLNFRTERICVCLCDGPVLAEAKIALIRSSLLPRRVWSMGVAQNVDFTNSMYWKNYDGRFATVVVSQDKNILDAARRAGKHVRSWAEVQTQTL